MTEQNTQVSFDELQVAAPYITLVVPLATALWCLEDLGRIPLAKGFDVVVPLKQAAEQSVNAAVKKVIDGREREAATEDFASEDTEAVLVED
jgi:hypothetical protein